MGHKSYEIEGTKHKLWTRGGTSDVFIEVISEDIPIKSIPIPAELIRFLVAEDIRAKRISELESFDTDQILDCSS